MSKEPAAGHRVTQHQRRPVARKRPGVVVEYQQFVDASSLLDFDDRLVAEQGARRRAAVPSCHGFQELVDFLLGHCVAPAAVDQDDNVCVFGQQIGNQRIRSSSAANGRTETVVGIWSTTKIGCRTPSTSSEIALVRAALGEGGGDGEDMQDKLPATGATFNCVAWLLTSGGRPRLL